ncbi:type II secretion system protein GspC [Rahnella bonaserana]|jgi:general secretion pathway protein C|uniref:Type II secretion system protein GspC n=1 Tax=Rahnella bonaserana TaxID=2816248 RepID=A0ABS6LR62_9GAMM|nr:type II secretion system protein GspC [Rahnella bonaserana]MBU9854609.1 type II secretion system protein GspC [Rahnella bonaserana]MCL9645414.1 type II secretion system protein GspC [Rahnella victoriana]WHZ41023.1 type II secretion system protein GspC [Rahnella bonaserana]
MSAIKNKGYWPKISLKMAMYIVIIFICVMICCSSIFFFVMSDRTNSGSLQQPSRTFHPIANTPNTLFENRKNPAVTQAVQAPVVNVMLPLVLKGVLTSSNNIRSLAILQGPSGQHSYREGEKIDDMESVYLQSVKPDEVLIRTPRGTATLSLNDKLRDNKSPKAIMDNAKREHAKYLIHYLVANPIYKNEKLTGYRFNPRTGSDIYLRAGLIPDEVVVKINGQALDDITTAEKYIGQLENLRDVQLTVLRENQLQNIYINLATIETWLDTKSYEEVH